MAKTAINILQNQIVPKNKHLCEPKLSKRKLYSNISSYSGFTKRTFAKTILDFLHYADGKNSLEDISKLIRLNPKKTYKIFKKFKSNKIIYD